MNPRSCCRHRDDGHGIENRDLTFEEVSDQCSSGPGGPGAVEDPGAASLLSRVGGHELVKLHTQILVGDEALVPRTRRERRDDETDSFNVRDEHNVDIDRPTRHSIFCRRRSRAASTTTRTTTVKIAHSTATSTTEKF